MVTLHEHVSHSELPNPGRGLYSMFFCFATAADVHRRSSHSYCTYIGDESPARRQSLLVGHLLLSDRLLLPSL